MTLTFSMAAIAFVGVFLASLMDAIAGGGGIISVPAYLMAGLPVHMALGTNKISASIGSLASVGRYVKNGYVDWRLAIPGVALALVGSYLGTRLQLMIPEMYLQYLLLGVLPVVAFVVLRKRSFPEVRGQMDERRRAAIVLAAALVIGAYDGFYGPGTGTFLLLICTGLAKMDVRTASGTIKMINMASGVSAMVTAAIYGELMWSLGLIAAVGALAGHYVGAGLTIKNGSKIVRPVVVLALLLLAVKVAVDLF